jgi:hypothetical protein
MENSKLLDFYRVLASEELRWFRDFVRSPYFNKKQELLPLCEHLIQLARQGFPPQRLKKEAVFRASYPQENFNEKTMAYRMSHLLKLGNAFLSQRHFEKNTITASINTLQAFHQRGLDKAYEQLFKRTQNQLEATQARNNQWLWQRFQLLLLAEERFASRHERHFSPFLQEASDALGEAFHAQQLRLVCTMVARERALNETYHYGHVLSYTPTSSINSGNSPLPSLFARLIDLLQSDNAPDLLEEFWLSIRQRRHELALEDLREFFYNAINYCIQQIRRGRASFTNALLQLYEEGLEEGFLLEDGELSPWNYKNIVKLGLGLGRFDWVDRLIAHYTDNLPESQREDAFHFNRADLHYHRQEYDEAFDHLNRVEFSDIHYVLGAKAMLVKIYYETQETEALLALLSSFKIYLQRNKVISQNIRDAYHNFLRFTERLLKAAPHHTENLRQKINQTKSLNDRSWLLRQIQAQHQIS